MALRNIIFTFTALLLITSCTHNGRKSGFGIGKDELAENIPNYVLFDVDSATLDPQARNVLNEQAKWLGAINTDTNI